LIVLSRASGYKFITAIEGFKRIEDDKVQRNIRQDDAEQA